ncbi:hypothetical protein ACFZCV_20780 [Streptomyces sp. NPDC007920]|uniref:hypothetical protein n=1 Tax=Streptomyces sp. NPDC007920 TaxID=3364794 RepID=UPI0036E1BB2B
MTFEPAPYVYGREQFGPDARAVVRAVDALTTQVKRIADAVSRSADARQGDFVLTPDAADDAPTTPDAGRPVPLATPCAACGHPYNWHDRPGWCEFKDDENRHCGCAEFVPGEKPQPVDPWRVLGAWAPAAPCEQHPNAPVIGGLCGGCTQYPTDMRPAPNNDEDAQAQAQAAEARSWPGELCAHCPPGTRAANLEQHMVDVHGARPAEQPTLRELLTEAIDHTLMPVVANRAVRRETARQAAAEVLAVILPTTRLLAGLRESAEADVSRVIALYERWKAAGQPPLGMSRWWDARLAELHDAISPPQPPTAPTSTGTGTTEK